MTYTQDEPNPFCSNRSEAGDACGSCPGCVAEVARIRRVLRFPAMEVALATMRDANAPADVRAAAADLIAEGLLRGEPGPAGEDPGALLDECADLVEALGLIPLLQPEPKNKAAAIIVDRDGLRWLS